MGNVVVGWSVFGELGFHEETVAGAIPGHVAGLVSV